MRRDKVRVAKVLRELGLNTLTDIFDEQPDKQTAEEAGQSGATYVKTNYLQIKTFGGEPVPQGVTIKGLPVEEQVVAVLAGEIVPHNLDLKISGGLFLTRREK